MMMVVVVVMMMMSEHQRAPFLPGVVHVVVSHTGLTDSRDENCSLWVDPCLRNPRMGIRWAAKPQC
jgi:hypothetical protein